MSESDPVRVRVRRRGDMAILDIEGEIDGFSDQTMLRAYAQAAAGGTAAGGTAGSPARLLLNFGGVSYINSTGIAVIVSVLAQARRDRIAVLCCGLTDHYQEIFRITRLADFVRVFRDEESAFAAA